MQKIIYSTGVKAATVLVILAGLISTGVFGFYSLLCVYVGGYQASSGGYHESEAYWRVLSDYAQDANSWYEISEKRQMAIEEKLGYGQEQQYQELTKRLQESSLFAVRIEERAENEMVNIPIAGAAPDETFEKLYYWDYFGYDNHDSEEELGYGYQIYLRPNANVQDDYAKGQTLYNQLWPNAWNYLVAICVSVIIALVGFIFLLVGAGRNKDGQIALNGMHRVPFDLLTLLGLAGASIVALALASMEGVIIDIDYLNPTLTLLIVGVLFIVALCMVWIHTAAARIKGHMLLRNTMIWRACAWVFGGLRGGVEYAVTTGQKMITGPQKKDKILQQHEVEKRKAWGLKTAVSLLAKARQACSVMRKRTVELIQNFPVIWKLCGVVAALMFMVELLASYMVYQDDIMLLLVVNILILMAVAFFAVQLRRLQHGGQQLAKGNLDYKIPTEHMYWDLQQHAKDLNAISSGMAVAVEERIKSERMKYELLTNVSHDIKTPLTSIINYVDLLKGEEIAGEKAQEYIAVLDRQSAKLKKLITDLIEVSKATTGNIAVQADYMQAGELLRQCVGEYTERFAEKHLEAVLSIPTEEPTIFADGRLLWRVFDNLLGNIVKYAMPNTRVYIDLETGGNAVTISLKNISKDRLNLAANELMERFVRGDISRATEGSGLGLSISQSLTELMQGQFELTVDGDLFKITLGFHRIINQIINEDREER